MKKLILYMIFLMIFITVPAYAWTLHWDASVNADEPGIPAIQYRVYEGLELNNMVDIDDVDGLSWRIPDGVPFGTLYQVTAFNSNGESPRSIHVVFINTMIPITPGGLGIKEDDPVGYHRPWAGHRGGREWGKFVN